MRKWLLPVCLVALLVIGGGVLWHTGVLHRISSKGHLIALLQAGGWTGALLCIAVQFLQVVIAVIPGEITSVAAGYVFGAWRGFLYSAIGVTLGSAFNFWFARVVGRPARERQEQVGDVPPLLAAGFAQGLPVLRGRVVEHEHRRVRGVVGSGTLPGPARKRPDRQRCVARRLSLRDCDRAVGAAGDRRVLLVPAVQSNRIRFGTARVNSRLGVCP